LERETERGRRQEGIGNEVTHLQEVDQNLTDGFRQRLKRGAKEGSLCRLGIDCGD